MVDHSARDGLVEVYEALAEAMPAMRRTKSRWAEEHPGVPPGTIGLLARLDRRESEAGAGCRLKDLARMAGLDASTVSREIGQLISLGLVERRSDPHDGRAARLALTPAGRDHLDRVRASIVGQLGEALDDWEPEELTAFAAMLHRFADGLHGHVSTHTPPLEVFR
jgi:DNA-binding MarR family transcriptional regulator